MTQQMLLHPHVIAWFRSRCGCFQSLPSDPIDRALSVFEHAVAQKAPPLRRPAIIRRKAPLGAAQLASPPVLVGIRLLDDFDFVALAK